MFNETKVTHKKYGNGIVTDFEIDPEDQLKSKVSVKFDDTNEIKKFAMLAFAADGFFKTDDDSIIPFVEQLKIESEEKHKAEIRRRAEAIEYIPSYELNEVGVEVSKADWEKAMAVAGNYRFPNESRAVVMDSDLIFINASAAMRYMESRIKDCDKIYKACEAGNKFLGHTWGYASREAIEHIISLIED